MLYKFLLCAHFIATAMAVSAQDVLFGIKGGVNGARFSENLNVDAALRWGPQIGIFMNNRKGLQAELNFSSFGQRNNVVSGSGTKVGETTVRSSYVTLPILGEIGKKAFRIHVGPQVGFLLAAKETGTISGQTVNDNLSEEAKPIDIGLCAGFSLHPSENTSIG